MRYFTPRLLTGTVLKALGLWQRRPTVLVIDVEEGVRRFISETLERNGYEVIEAPDGEVALQLLLHQRVHLVYSDLATSVRNGVDSIRRMRRFFPNLKIVAMSSGIPTEVLDMSSLVGADAALAKPITVDLLVKTTRRLLAD